MPAPRARTPLEDAGLAALAEFTAIVADVGINVPGERPASWWVSVRDAVCAYHGVPSLLEVGTGRHRRAA